jgi:formate hydrogenlyase subunit 3/multisubunit Na+/H+ antiporter MnhD subunit
MTAESLLALAAALWLLAIALGVLGVGRRPARLALALGCAAAAAAALGRLPGGVAFAPLWPGVAGTRLALAPDALWLLLFGAIAAFFATALGSPTASWRSWSAGAGLCLLGALGCFGVQDAPGFLIAWELMSLGGAVLLVGERLGPTRDGHGLLFMLGLLEVGAIALTAALLLAAQSVGSLDFADFGGLATHAGGARQLLIGLLLLVGFGAKLGLLPFYEWYPGAYGQGSGASGALLSGIVLNAAFFALERGYTAWLPGSLPLGVVTVAAGVLSAILAVLYAFQEDDWRRLLAFSSAENAAIAVTVLGACAIFRSEGLQALASLGYLVALLHLAGHALAKGCLMLAADGAYRAAGSYAIRQQALLRHGRWYYGVGVVFAGMSLAAMPPQAGFVSEWFTFQTLFQGFHLDGLGGRLTLSLAGAGMALTAAVAFATFVKLVGLGALGRRAREDGAAGRVPGAHAAACGLLGLGVLALAVGMPWWLHALDGASAARFAGQSSLALRKDLLLVPLTDGFAFISPTKLALALPLLALIPCALLLRARLRHRPRRAPVWYGGFARPPHGATTSLTFSNAMRTFYAFVYRPETEVGHEYAGSAYFVRRVLYRAQVSPLFEAKVFRVPVRAVQWLARGLSPLQSGHMNFYLGLVGVLLVLIMAVALV